MPGSSNKQAAQRRGQAAVRGLPEKVQLPSGAADFQHPEPQGLPLQTLHDDTCSAEDIQRGQITESKTQSVFPAHVAFAHLVCPLALPTRVAHWPYLLGVSPIRLAYLICQKGFVQWPCPQHVPCNLTWFIPQICLYSIGLLKRLCNCSHHCILLASCTNCAIMGFGQLANGAGWTRPSGRPKNQPQGFRWLTG